jgi:hypothetical protein
VPGSAGVTAIGPSRLNWSGLIFSEDRPKVLWRRM